VNRPAPWTPLAGEAWSCEAGSVQAMQFEATVARGTSDRVMVPVPFHPDHLWGVKPRHHVTGTVSGIRVRAVIEPLDDGFGFVLGPAWLRGCGVEAGDRVLVSVMPEGPQRADLPADFAEALDANPSAGQFFDGLAQFYRRAYVGWIDATKRSPDKRAERIATVVQLLADGHKARPMP
jgi:hypothetical protein